MRTVVGSLSDTDSVGGKFVPDYYSFKAAVGTTVTIEAMSALLEGGDRYVDPTDLTIILLDGTSGAIIDYKPGPPITPAANDDDFATAERGSSLIDVVLPPVFDTSPETGIGTYVIELLSADTDLFFVEPDPEVPKMGMDGGSYELLVYQAATVFIVVPEPTSGLLAVLASCLVVASRQRRPRRQKIETLAFTNVF
jgi:hypothetical protein